MKLKLDDLTYRVAFLDPAGKRRGQELRRVRAHAAIVVIGADLLQRIFVLDVWRGRSGALAIADQVFKLNETWKPNVFGCEANAMQELYADMLLVEAKHRQKKLPLAAIHQPTTVDKNWRIRTALQPVIGNGRLFIRDDQLSLKHELTNFPMSQTVDVIDALASAVLLVPARSLFARRSAERDALADYLRKAGVPPGQLDRRLEEWDRQHGEKPQAPALDRTGPTLY